MNSVTHARRSLLPRTLCLVAVALLGGCAHDPDIGRSPDNVVGQTARSDAAFLHCVQGDLDRGTPVIAAQGGGGTRLLVGDADPAKASALLVVSGGRYAAYQRDAWYDKGRFLDSALSCARQQG